MKLLLIVLLGGACWAQNVPAPDIVGATNQNINSINQANSQAAQTALIRQQTELLKRQTEALKQQNELLKAQQQAAARKPRIDDLDPVTKLPKYKSWVEYENAKDEWLIEEAVRRFQASQRSH